MPGGSYAFMKSALEKNAEEELAVLSGIIRVVFDNEQILEKRYTINVDNPRVPISVITSHSYLLYETKNSQSNIQSCKVVSLKNWKFIEPVGSFKDMSNFSAKFSADFRLFRNNFIQSRILAQEQRWKEQSNNYVDFVDEALDGREHSDCFVEFDSSSEKFNPYEHFKIPFIVTTLKSLWENHIQ